MSHDDENKALDAATFSRAVAIADVWRSVKPAAPGTVEAWGRSPDIPVGGWYGLRNGYRGRFGMYLPPLLEALALAEVTHEPRNNSIKAI